MFKGIVTFCKNSNSYFIRYAVGNSFKICFHHDLWNWDTTLKDGNLIDGGIDAKVADYLEYINGCFYWNPLFIRALHDWELECMAQLLVDIYATRICRGGVNKLE